MSEENKHHCLVLAFAEYATLEDRLNIAYRDGFTKIVVNAGGDFLLEREESKPQEYANKELLTWAYRELRGFVIDIACVDTGVVSDHYQYIEQNRLRARRVLQAIEDKQL